VPSEVYIAIGRDRYDTEYEVAEATAEAVRTNTADSIPRWLAAITPAAEAGQ
jgi:phosphomannomutase